MFGLDCFTSSPVGLIGCGFYGLFAGDLGVNKCLGWAELGAEFSFRVSGFNFGESFAFKKREALFLEFLNALCLGKFAASACVHHKIMELDNLDNFRIVGDIFSLVDGELVDDAMVVRRSLRRVFG